MAGPAPKQVSERCTDEALLTVRETRYARFQEKVVLPPSVDKVSPVIDLVVGHASLVPSFWLLSSSTDETCSVRRNRRWRIRH